MMFSMCAPCSAFTLASIRCSVRLATHLRQACISRIDHDPPDLDDLGTVLRDIHTMLVARGRDVDDDVLVELRRSRWRGVLALSTLAGTLRGERALRLLLRICAAALVWLSRRRCSHVFLLLSVPSQLQTPNEGCLGCGSIEVERWTRRLCERLGLHCVAHVSPFCLLAEW